MEMTVTVREKRRDGERGGVEVRRIDKAREREEGNKRERERERQKDRER